MGEPLGYHTSRPCQCPTFFFKTQDSFDCFCALIRNSPARPVPAAVRVVGCCTVATIPANRVDVCPKFDPTLNLASAFAAACVANARHRSRFVSWADVSTWQWRWFWCLPGMPGRHQNHRHCQVDTSAQETNRDRCRAFATHAAAKAEARFKVGSNFGQTSTRFAGIVATVQHPTTRTAAGTGLAGEFLINAQKQSKESWVLKKKVGHWQGLEVW